MIGIPQLLPCKADSIRQLFQLIQRLRAQDGFADQYVRHPVPGGSVPEGESSPADEDDPEDDIDSRLIKAPWFRAISFS